MRSTLIVMALGLAAVSARADWDTLTGDILDENYGNGSAEVAYNDSWVYAWGTSAPGETLSAGMTTLDIPAGAAYHYPTKATIAGMTTGNADVTIEFKAALSSNAQLNTYWSETNSTHTSNWNHLVTINRLWQAGDQAYQEDALSDYNKRTDDLNEAPAGYDSSYPHKYRIVHDNGVSSLYVDDGLDPVSVLGGGAGAAPDGMNILMGFVQDPAAASSIDFYYLRIANGAHHPIPEPASLALLAAGGLLMSRRRR